MFIEKLILFFRCTAERDLFYCIAVASPYNKRGDTPLDHTTHCYKLSGKVIGYYTSKSTLTCGLIFGGKYNKFA